MSALSESVEVSGQKLGRFSEKPSFSQKCSMLSQYLKERGSFGDLTLGMTCTVEPNGTSEMYRQTGTTMDLFPVVEKSRNMATPRDLKFMSLFPQQSGFISSVPEPEVPKMADYSLNKRVPGGEPERAQMTIFYGGQVIVLNDFPAEKAKEVMLLASQESSRSQTAAAYVSNQAANAFPTHVAKSPIESSNSVPQSPSVPNFGNKVIQEPIQPPSRPIVCDLPIARKASLHRFLEKRKDRISAKAPYQTGSPEVAPTKPSEGKSWLGLAAQSTQ
ncbi:Protein TIFY 10A [Morus notabilis]|uniref:Protein TIFY n=1 Tax=Morus notabilis TaxID=981085 RepID=W9RJP2_9ROSA|nr:protein TIFY 10A [Morus notabilis]EXB76744.1 Protein TIFY 10A [Morus notabilis]